MSVLADTGRLAIDGAQNAGYSVRLLWRTILSLGYLPRRLRFTLDMAYNAGVRALPVTMIVALFAGMILALQTGIELQKLGQSNLIGNITALSMCREMGPFITGIILAGMNSYLVEALTLGLMDEGASTPIGIGMWLGLIMWFNVWFIIWPSQRKALGLVEA